MQAHVHLRLVQQLDEVHVVGDDLPQVGHFLEQLGEQLQGVRVVELQLQLQGVKNRLLKLLDGLHVKQAGSVWIKGTDTGVGGDSYGPQRICRVPLLASVYTANVLFTNAMLSLFPATISSI